eukprot:CAMPEP_0196658526 /NCGR_PEP_ID=MMETSP1086-20130531/30160_1 /TAXON_ID=77921 /ORGANISM="Cyanoptyche  gloeocystis , Strain SAG4.97" /LENGTH=168 /DNA_ID=CAMNT_0041992145 /DNA_START=67 /DNA_END=574 /DNA_ORIENTATION=-
MKPIETFFISGFFICAFAHFDAEEEAPSPSPSPSPSFELDDFEEESTPTETPAATVCAKFTDARPAHKRFPVAGATKRRSAVKAALPALRALAPAAPGLGSRLNASRIIAASTPAAPNAPTRSLVPGAMRRLHATSLLPQRPARLGSSSHLIALVASQLQAPALLVAL